MSGIFNVPQEMQDRTKSLLLDKDNRKDVLNKLTTYLLSSAKDIDIISKHDYSAVYKDMLSRISGLIDVIEEQNWVKLYYFLLKYDYNKKYDISPNGKKVIDNDYERSISYIIDIDEKVSGK